VHAVVPDGDQPVAVRVRAGGPWTLGGVLGDTREPAEVVRLLAENGVEGVAGRVLAVAGDGCSLAWQRPRGPRSWPARAGRTRRGRT
jgi:hypothetical protein